MPHAVAGSDSTFKSAGADGMSNAPSAAARPTARDNGVQLLGEIDDSLSDLFPSLLSVYEQQGYREGYQRAVHDLLARLVHATEDFIQSQNVQNGVPGHPLRDVKDLRRLLYQFGEHLETRLLSMLPANTGAQGYVSDGLGI